MGKHVTIQAPKRSGSLYFNYKGAFSTVLLALVDVRYRFIAGYGRYGRNSDGGTFSDSVLGTRLEKKTLCITPDTPLRSIRAGQCEYIHNLCFHCESYKQFVKINTIFYICACAPRANKVL
ncbi:UNVERIFIED_CONTAM: hypothetical protein FKN15_029444 [Acipenser sinensis]